MASILRHWVLRDYQTSMDSHFHRNNLVGEEMKNYSTMRELKAISLLVQLMVYLMLLYFKYNLHRLCVVILETSTNLFFRPLQYFYIRHHLIQITYLEVKMNTGVLNLKCRVSPFIYTRIFLLLRGKRNRIMVIEVINAIGLRF